MLRTCPIPGHKTDKKDSAWLSKLLLSGLLKGSFVPPVDIRELRDLVRYKNKKTQVVASEKNRMIKILEDCNVKLSSVVSDVQRVSATKIVNSIANGESDVEKLMSHLHGKIQANREDIKKCLRGKSYRIPLFYAKHVARKYRCKCSSNKKLDLQIEKAIQKYQVESDLLQTIEGIGKDSAIAIISEIGVDMKQLTNEHHLASWSGVSPGNNESGGEKKHKDHKRQQVSTSNLNTKRMRS